MEDERRQKVEELFHSALAFDTVQRTSFLTEACGVDEELRERVESLISSYQQAAAAGFLQHLLCDASSWSLVESETHPNVGRQVGGYKIIREIGHGGVGAVYLAERDDGEFQRRVAVKLIKRGMDTDYIIKRFRKEWQILASLDHPYIARLIDGGTTDDGLPYFIMEYIEGQTIDEYCDEHKLTIRKRLELFRKLCSAVQYAHDHGVIHRDIKPGNILINAEGEPKLLDFGIAKVLTGETDLTRDKTLTALRMMTPEYASPEQVCGGNFTPATDVYTLGVLLYELLSGHRPYYLESNSPEEIARVICEQAPEKPSTAISRVKEVTTRGSRARITLTPERVSATREGKPQKLRRRLRGDLDNIVLVALRKDPIRRYVSVEEFSEDIRRHLQLLPVVARRDSLAYRGAKLVKRNKIATAATVLTVMAVLALIFTVLSYRLRLRTSPVTVSPNIRSVAVLPLENLSGDPSQDYFADGMTDEMITNLGKIRALRVTSRTSVMQYKGTKKSLSEIARALNVDGVIEGSAKLVGNRVRITAQLIEVKADRQLWSESYERDVRDILALQDEVARAIAEAVKIKLAPEERMRLSRVRSVDPEAQEAYFKGRHHASKRNEEGLRTAITYYQEAIAKDKLYPHPHIGLAEAYQALGTFMVGALPPAESFPKVEAAAREALNLDETLAEGHTLLAVMRLYRWEWREAAHGLKLALELNPSYALAHSWYSQYLASQARLDEARAEAKRAHELDPLSPYIAQNVAHIAYYARQYDEMIEYSRQALELDPNYVWARWRLGTAYAMQSRFEEAIAEGERAAALSRRSPAALSNLAMAYGRAGRRAEAQQVFNELVELSKRTYVNPFSFFSIHIALGQNDQALQRLEEAVQSHLSGMIFILVNPELDPIRSDPRFKELVRRMGLSDQNAAMTAAS